MFDRLSPKKLSDEKLAEKAQKSEHYFAILYDRRSQKVYGFVRWRVGSKPNTTFSPKSREEEKRLSSILRYYHKIKKEKKEDRKPIIRIGTEATRHKA